jgi:hypothetical protein
MIAPVTGTPAIGTAIERGSSGHTLDRKKPYYDLSERALL